MTGNRKLSAAAICVCVSLFAFGAQPGRAQSETAAQQKGALAGGGSYILRRDPAAPTAAIELWYRAPGAGYDNATPGISRLALAALAASAPPHGTSLEDAVKQIGGSLSIDVYPDIAMVGISVPATQATAMLKALTSAYFAQQLSDAGYRAALRDCAIASAESQFDAERQLQDALFERLFSAGPAHYPAVPPAVADFTNITQAQVKAFAARAFRRENAILTMAGGVPAGIVAGAPGAAAASADAPIDSTLSRASIDAAAAAKVSGTGFAWTGPPISDPKAATAMDFIADYLFDAERGTVARAVRRKGGDAFVSGQFVTLHDPGVLVVTAGGEPAAQAREQVLQAVQAMSVPLDAQTFAAARNAFEYHIMTQTQTPVSRADNFGWYAAEGNASYAPGDAAGEYVKEIESLDPAYVAGIARTYLQHPAVVELTQAPAQTAGGTAR